MDFWSATSWSILHYCRVEGPSTISIIEVAMVKQHKASRNVPFNNIYKLAGWRSIMQWYFAIEINVWEKTSLFSNNFPSSNISNQLKLRIESWEGLCFSYDFLWWISRIPDLYMLSLLDNCHWERSNTKEFGNISANVSIDGWFYRHPKLFAPRTLMLFCDLCRTIYWIN